MGGDRFQEQLADSAAKSRPHSTHSEGNEADKRATLVKIELLRNATPQFLRIGFVMNEDGVVPMRVEERLAADR